MARKLTISEESRDPRLVHFSKEKPGFESLRPANLFVIRKKQIPQKLTLCNFWDISDYLINLFNLINFRNHYTL